MDTSTTDVLFGRTRQAILRLLLMRPDETFHLRHIVRLTHTPLGAADRELKALARGGIVSRRQIGRQVFYAANRALPVFPELSSLVAKTAGLADVIKAQLAALLPQIELALIFGSMASGEPTPQSDVDLLIVSKTLELSAIVQALKPAQDILYREINPILYTPEEFSSKLNAGHRFVQQVMASAKIVLAGELDEFERMGETRLAQAPQRRRARSGQPARRR
jgi:predicted nucleotidyltransferase